MRRRSHLIAALTAAAIALAPAFADARPGGGSSMGSRGSRTWSAPPSTQTAPGYARPMERSVEPQRPSTPYAQPAPSTFGRPNPAGGFFSRSPFLTGLAGGLLGAGLFGLLSGHGLFGGFTGIGSFLGLILQIGLVVLLVRFALAWFRRRQAQPAYAGMPNAMLREAPPTTQRAPYGTTSGAPQGSAIQLSPADFEAFERALKTVNLAWSHQNEQEMRAVATPEMMKYFGDDLADLHRRGLRNETADVVLEKGDLAEAWREGGRDYATVAMRFSQIDVTRRLDNGAVVEGDPVRRVTVTELWTFLRDRGGPWMLSAIQQTT